MPAWPPAPDRLMRKATAYLARQLASTARLKAVLARAIQREAPEGEAPDAATLAGMIDPIVARLARAGLLDDAAVARAKATRLVEKGRPAAMIRAELRHRHGLDVDEAGLAGTLAALDPAAQARRWAERRRLGPFRRTPRPDKREADIASLVRAGFSASVARAAIDAERSDEG